MVLRYYRVSMWRDIWDVWTNCSLNWRASASGWSDINRCLEDTRVSLIVRYWLGLSKVHTLLS